MDLQFEYWLIPLNNCSHTTVLTPSSCGTFLGLKFSWQNGSTWFLKWKKSMEWMRLSTYSVVSFRWALTWFFEKPAKWQASSYTKTSNRFSDSFATCSVTIPYTWEIASQPYSSSTSRATPQGEEPRSSPTVYLLTRLSLDFRVLHTWEYVGQLTRKA